MQIDITRLFESDTWAFSGSIATHGANAGPSTWNAAKAEAAESPILNTDDELQAFRDHMQGFGAWEEDKIAGWDKTECNALFVQLVSGDMREQGLDDMTADDDEAWVEFEASDTNANFGGSIYRGDDKRVYYYLGD